MHLSVPVLELSDARGAQNRQNCACGSRWFIGEGAVPLIGGSLVQIPLSAMVSLPVPLVLNPLLHQGLANRDFSKHLLNK